MYFNSLVKWFFVIVLNVSCLLVSNVDGSSFSIDTLSRTRRQLLFPNTTMLQFNAGIGTPSPSKMVNVNWAFQANFVLPWNRTQIPIDILEANSGYTGFARKKRDADTAPREGDYENDAKLYHFYKYVEDILNSFGHNGSSCVLQTLCRLGAEPLHTNNEDDLLHELATFVLNPTNDADNEVTEENESFKYIQAYKQGEGNQDCDELYHCSTSLVDHFSKLDIDF